MAAFFHMPLPTSSAFLAGRGPVPEGEAVQTDRIQIYLRTGDDLSGDRSAHAHTACDEFIIVLEGSVTVEVEGRTHTIGKDEFCHFGIGQFHRIAAASADVRALVIRAPSVEDKLLA